MTFSDLAEALSLPSDSLRVIFSRHKWSIHQSKDVRQFLITRFSDKKIRRVKQPWRKAEHIQKWQFVKKVKRPEVSPEEEKLIREEALAAAKERKMAAVARATAAEKNAELEEKIRILEGKLAQEGALVAEKERKIETLTRQNEEYKDKGQRIKETEPTADSDNVENPITTNYQLPTKFVPSAESRKKAARARREEKKAQRIKEPVVAEVTQPPIAPVAELPQPLIEPVAELPQPPIAPVAEVTQPPIAPEAQQTIEQPEPQIVETSESLKDTESAEATEIPAAESVADEPELQLAPEPRTENQEPLKPEPRTPNPEPTPAPSNPPN